MVTDTWCSYNQYFGWLLFQLQPWLIAVTIKIVTDGYAKITIMIVNGNYDRHNQDCACWLWQLQSGLCLLAMTFTIRFVTDDYDRYNQDCDLSIICQLQSGLWLMAKSVTIMVMIDVYDSYSNDFDKWVGQLQSWFWLTVRSVTVMILTN